MKNNEPVNFILCGLPGSGKTTLGKILAEKLNYAFIDLDRLIEQRFAEAVGQSMTCRQIFSQKGEAYFRDLEQQTLEAFSEKNPRNHVLALGGGTLDSPDNVSLLIRLGTILYLKGDLKELYRRITREGCPAFLDPQKPFESFKELAERRTPIFNKEADIAIEAPSKFPIFMGGDFLIPFLKPLKCHHYTIISDTHVGPIYGKELENRLKKEGLNASMVLFPAGEDYKTRETKELCENHLLKLGATRDTCVIGVGGGVVSDVAGFVASTYCRGIHSVMVPTSLLAMVDASIGGKTGVNVPEGKNLIGTIYQPSAVFILTETLKTLPQAENKNGIAEMIKHGLIADPDYFHFMKSQAKKLPMHEAIARSIAIKASIVEQDEKENGMRRLLNLGHTIAHALETVSNHEIAHGRAVAIGIVAESYLALQMDHLKEGDFKQIREIFDDYQVDLTLKKSLPPEKLMSLMKMDKKALSSRPRFVILKEIGKPLEFEGEYCTAVDEKLLIKTLNWMLTEFSI